MDKKELRIWGLVDRELDPGSTERERRLENVQERVHEYLADGELAETVVQEIVRAVEVHRRDWSIAKEPMATEPVSDVAYWRLLEDLDKRELIIRQGPDTDTRGVPPPWKPITADWLHEGVFFATASRQGRVSIEFDHRFSQRSLVAQIRSLWPKFLKQGWVRQTRPLKPRAITLIRLVCLELPPGTNWGERLASWNKRYGKKHGRYDDVFPFSRDFRRAERQLTGEQYGLEPFYSRFSQSTEDELITLSEQGDKDARRYLDRVILRQYNVQYAIQRIKPLGMFRYRRPEGGLSK